MAAGVGGVFAALHFRLFPVIVRGFLRKRALSGCDGAVHLRLDAHDARPFAIPLVRRRSWRRRSDSRAAHPARTYREWRVSSGRATGNPAGSRSGRDPAILLGDFPAQWSPARLARLSSAGDCTRALGRADGRWPVTESAHRHVRQCQPLVRTGTPNAARHRHGDGPVRKPAQRSAGKYAGSFDLRSRSAAAFFRRRPDSEHASCARAPAQCVEHGSRRHRDQRTLAGSLAFRAARILGGVPGRFGRKRGRGLRLRTRLPQERDPYGAESSRDD